MLEPRDLWREADEGVGGRDWGGLDEWQAERDGMPGRVGGRRGWEFETTGSTWGWRVPTRLGVRAAGSLGLQGAREGWRVRHGREFEMAGSSRRGLTERAVGSLCYADVIT